MVTQPRRPARIALGVAALASLAITFACDKLPLLAPADSTITLTVSAPTVSANGHSEVVATVLEKGGNPVHNGTLVTFTTTIGRIEPAEARTHNGIVSVRFIATGESGTATVTAFSGAASKTIDLKVGAAAAERLTLTARPAALPPGGGSVDVVALVQDAAGNRLAGVPVSFSTDKGQVTPSFATTDANGEARTTLTGNQAATVTATAGSKTGTVAVGLGAALTLTAPASITQGQPATFTVAAPTGTSFSNVTVDFGDGTVRSFSSVTGSMTIAHTYDRAGTFSVTASGTDASSGTRASTTAIVAVGPAAPINPTFSAMTGTAGNPTTFTATCSGCSVSTYGWNFGDGTGRTTSSATTSHVYSAAGTYTVTLTVTTTDGRQGTAQQEIKISP